MASSLLQGDAPPPPQFDIIGLQKKLVFLNFKRENLGAFCIW